MKEVTCRSGEVPGLGFETSVILVSDSDVWAYDVVDGGYEHLASQDDATLGALRSAFASDGAVWALASESPGSVGGGGGARLLGVDEGYAMFTEETRLDGVAYAADAVKDGDDVYVAGRASATAPAEVSVFEFKGGSLSRKRRVPLPARLQRGPVRVAVAGDGSLIVGTDAARSNGTDASRAGPRRGCFTCTSTLESGESDHTSVSRTTHLPFRETVEER